MDVTTTKRKKSSRNKNKADVISRLPNSLIHHILSFIDTKYAVQTSVLSKRWIDVWKSLPFLNFNRVSFKKDFKYKESFIIFVDMVMLFRDDSADIQKFTLEWDNSAFHRPVIGQVNKWMLAAVKRNVQKIVVEFGQKYHMVYKIPHQLFNCKSLREFMMRTSGGCSKLDIALPNSMCLPQLQELSLLGFSITNVELTKKLFSSCPVLETFFMSDFNIPDSRNFNVDSPSLKKVGLYTSGFHGKHDGLPHETITGLTTLCAPNLKEFICKGFMTQEYSLGNFSSLVGAVILLKLKEEIKDETLDAYSQLPAEEKEVYGNSMMKFLVAVHKVVHMRLSSGFVEVLSRAPNLLHCQLLHFSNLELLELEMWFTRDSLRSVAYLLKISPVISSVVLTSMESNSADVGNDWEEGLSSPGMLSTLKYVEFKEVVGCDSELKLLSFLLKNAVVLKEVGLFFRSTVGSPDRVKQVKQFRDGLRALPTASSNIKIMLF